MEAAIEEGGSVLYNGRIVASVDDLPSKAELARGDAEEEAAVAAEIDAQIAALEAQRAKLHTAAPADTPSEYSEPVEGEEEDAAQQQ